MQAPNVSNDELLEDIKNTEIECDAYFKIYIGYKALSGLPENSGTKEREYRYEHDRYQRHYANCENFLNKLMEIKKERGL